MTGSNLAGYFEWLTVVRAKFYLWLHGYCTKHGTRKTLEFNLPGAGYICEACEEERENTIDDRLERALEILNHRLD